MLDEVPAVDCANTAVLCSEVDDGSGKIMLTHNILLIVYLSAQQKGKPLNDSMLQASDNICKLGAHEISN